EKDMPKWTPGTVNQYQQDDIYVEMSFLRTLELLGLDVSVRQAGIDFANSGYPLWHANDAGRKNLRRGIAPPDSGHPQFNKHADDIDYQIESDFSGLIAPGLPNFAVELGETFGRLMNYGDGVYGGQFIGAMYAEAFFESDAEKIIRAALPYIPADSQYAGMVRDVLAWVKENPDDWQKTWQLVEEKYHKDPAYTHGLCSKPGGVGAFSIDVKLNGAYVLMGLLYGKGDPDKTVLVACRSGQDSDCNPANAAGILFTTMGAAKIPGRFTEKLDLKAKYSFTEYTLPKVFEVSEKLAREAVVRGGGKIEKDAAGQEVFVIPVQEPKPPKLEQVTAPGPVANSKFTPEEMAQIKTPPEKPKGGQANQAVDIKAAVEKFAPGWSVAKCGPDMSPGLREEWGGRKNVLMTHPLSESTACVLSKKIDVPAGKKTVLHLVVTNDPRGDFDLLVRADGKDFLKKSVKVNAGDVTDKWLTEDLDLSPLAGKTVAVEIVNQATGWQFEAAYFADIKITSE
ncbi:MAG: ADP-ribosylglycohydrolase family protein, partial [Planctomycetota bacterium]|nr:ADP-ribosylglycohydrolase family protein [Planctomycetota bacterium]